MFSFLQLWPFKFGKVDEHNSFGAAEDGVAERQLRRPRFLGDGGIGFHPEFRRSHDDDIRGDTRYDDATSCALQSHISANGPVTAAVSTVMIIGR